MQLFSFWIKPILDRNIFVIFSFCLFVFSTVALSAYWGSIWSYNYRSIPQSQQHRIQAESATYTTAHGNAGSLTHWARPGIEPATSWFLVRFINHWAPTGTPICTLNCSPHLALLPLLDNLIIFSFRFQTPQMGGVPVLCFPIYFILNFLIIILLCLPCHWKWPCVGLSGQWSLLQTMPLTCLLHLT